VLQIGINIPNHYTWNFYLHNLQKYLLLLL